MASRSGRVHKPTSKFLNYVTEELSPPNENGQKEKLCTRSSQNSFTLKDVEPEPARSVKRKIRDDKEVVKHLKKTNSAQSSSDSSSSTDTRRSGRFRKTNPKFKGFIQCLSGKANGRDQNQSKHLRANFEAKTRSKNVVAAVSPMVRVEGVETPVKFSKQLKVGLVDCFDGLTNDLALIHRQPNISVTRKASNVQTGHSNHSNRSVINSGVTRQRRDKLSSVACASKPINVQCKTNNTSSSKIRLRTSKSPTLSLRSHGRRVHSSTHSNHSASSNENNSQNVVKQLLSGETLRYVRPNPIVTLRNSSANSKKQVVNSIGLRNAVKRPNVTRDDQSTKHRRLELKRNRNPIKTKLTENDTMTDSVRKLFNQRNSITVTRKQYPLRKPAIATVTISSDDVTNSSSSSNLASQDSPTRPSSSQKQIIRKRRPHRSPASPNSPKRPLTSPKQKIMKKRRVLSKPAAPNSPTSPPIAPKHKIMKKRLVNQISGTNKTRKKNSERNADQESEDSIKIKETIKKFLIMGTKVANAISESLKHDEEALLSKSSAFEKKCLNLVHALAMQGADLEEEDMEKVLQLLDEEQEERKQYRHTFLESLKVSHFTNMALYSQMLRLLKTL